MKRFFFIAAIAGAALVSCTKNEVAQVENQDAITFARPVTATATKAVEIVDDYPTEYNFSVFGHYFTGIYTTIEEGQLYMDNVETAYSEECVGWDPKAVENGVNYYWPKQGTITFAAYSPSSAEEDMDEVSYTGRGIQFKNFVVADKAEDQYDLLFSERAYNQTKADMTTEKDPYKGVQIKFNHALSSIYFTVNTDIDYTPDNYEINVTKIELRGVKNTGIFDQGLVDANNRITRVNTEWPGWTVLDDSPVKTYVAFEGDQELTEKATPTENIEERENLNNNTNLILLPQRLTNVKLYVEYTIYNNNTNAVVEQTAELPITQYGTVAQWFRGNRYIYNITIGLDKIYFDPTVKPWENVQAGTVTIGK